MNIYRIEISPLPEWHDARGEKLQQQIRDFFKFDPGVVRTRDVYTLEADITPDEAEKLAKLLCNNVLQFYRVGERRSENYVDFDKQCTGVVAVGFRPGVTDNVARTLRDAAGDV